MSQRAIKDQFDSIQALIFEYESKNDKPTLEGFSMYLTRMRCMHLTNERIRVKEMAMPAQPGKG